MAESLDIANQLITPINTANDPKNKIATAAAIDNSAKISGIEQPTWAQALDHIPTISQSIGYSTFRGSNTLMRGGFMDFKRFGLPGRAGRYHYFNKAGAMTNPGSGRFYGGQIFGGRGMGRLGRRARTAALPTPHSALGKQGIMKSGRLNNLSPNYLRGRFHSLSVFGGNAALYSPFGAAGMMGRTAVGRGMASLMGIKGLGKQDLAFGPGLLSNIAASVRTDALERKFAARGSGLLGGRGRKLAKVDRSIMALGQYNGLSATFIDDALKTGGAGVRGNLLASSAAGAGTAAILGYGRGVMGGGGQAGLSGKALEYAGKAEARFAEKFAKMGLGTEAEGIAKLRSTFGKNFIKEMGGIGQASRFGGFLGTRALFAALPVVNAVATVSLLYELGKLGGMAIKGAVNLAKDAGKSLQGTIAKPLFGMGYKDTEAAATSRARGVMAIQNSQLNARSALGSEASMLSAHFG